MSAPGTICHGLCRRRRRRLPASRTRSGTMRASTLRRCYGNRRFGLLPETPKRSGRSPARSRPPPAHSAGAAPVPIRCSGQGRLPALEPTRSGAAMTAPTKAAASPPLRSLWNGRAGAASRFSPRRQVSRLLASRPCRSVGGLAASSLRGGGAGSAPSRPPPILDLQPCSSSAMPPTRDQSALHAGLQVPTRRGRGCRPRPRAAGGAPQTGRQREAWGMHAQRLRSTRFRGGRGLLFSKAGFVAAWTAGALARPPPILLRGELPTSGLIRGREDSAGVVGTKQGHFLTLRCLDVGLRNCGSRWLWVFRNSSSYF